MKMTSPFSEKPNGSQPTSGPVWKVWRWTRGEVRPFYGPPNPDRKPPAPSAKSLRKVHTAPPGYKAPRCSKIKRNGEQCGRRAIKGGTVCITHGGKAPNVLAAADRRLARLNAEYAMEKLGLGQGRDDVDPAEVMLDMVRAAAYNIRVYEDAIAGLNMGHGGQGERDTVVLELWGAQGSITLQANTLVELYNEERDRAVKFAAACRKAGVEEYRVQITADQGRKLADAIRSTSTGTLSAVREALAQRGVDLPDDFWATLAENDLPRVMMDAVREVQVQRPPEPTPIARAAEADEVTEAELVEEGE